MMEEQGKQVEKKKTRRKRLPRGLGSLYRRKNSPFYTISFIANGVRQTEATKCARKEDAVDLLMERNKELRTGTFAPRANKVKLTDLRDAVITDCTRNGRTYVVRVRQLFAHLERLLGAGTTADVVGARLDRYVTDRLAEEHGPERKDAEGNPLPRKTTAPATVNRELEILRRGFRLMVRQRRLAVAPHFPTMKENNTRTRCPSAAEVEAVIAKLPERLQEPIRFIKLTGWRSGEAFNLQWKHVDLEAQVIRLEASEVKNRRDARILPYGHDPELAALIEERRTLTEVLEREHGAIIPWVFSYTRRTRTRRVEILGVQPDADAWKLACEAAQVADFHVHDLRRAFAGECIRAGVDERTVMKLAGWRTRSMFDRYSVRSTEDLEEGVTKLAAARQAQSPARVQRRA